MACTLDFRNLDEGFGGKTYKRKREVEAIAAAAAINGDSMEVDTLPPPAKRSAVSSAENPDKPVFGNPTYDGVIAGKVSGRKWKQVRTQRSSAKLVSRRGSAFEDRKREKEIKNAYRERVNELKEEIRKNKQEKRKVRAEREKKKKENILKTGTKLQKITNPNTLKKISKSKNRKSILKVVPDDVFNKKTSTSKKQ